MNNAEWPVELLTAAEMGAADARAITAGTPGHVLMRRAGRAVSDAVGRLSAPPGPVLVLCGPGNNGGDGFVAATFLARRGWSVRVALLGDPGRLSGDAATAFADWNGPLEIIDDSWCRTMANDQRTPAVVVDALFGAGLSRPFNGAPAMLLARLRQRGGRIVAVDVPSGLDGTTGRIRGGDEGRAVPADVTVTFFRLKPGHCLQPGRSICGRTDLVDIGIDPTVLHVIAPTAHINRPAAWDGVIPAPTIQDHKYSRGHVVVLGGEMIGAARLAAAAARRLAGYVTLAGEGVDGICAVEPGLVLRPGAGGWESAMSAAVRRPDHMAAVIGPGAGVGDAAAAERLRGRARDWLSTGAGLVLDADGLTAFSPAPDLPTDEAAGLPKSPKGHRLVLTPHSGEFARLFPDLAGNDTDKLSSARAAARATGAVVVLKGGDTVIAAPDGRAAVSVDGPASLATAGTGDVLSGLIGALIAAGKPPFDAARMSVLLHGEAAKRLGVGLVAEDLPAAIADILRLGPTAGRRTFAAVMPAW